MKKLLWSIFVLLLLACTYVALVAVPGEIVRPQRTALETTPAEEGVA
jgi:hypothetical protein